ncbi:MAG: sarcosine oxidase subunit beta [Candidatus Krumholzibacteriia bacterium]|jgi:sarcosine oxidase subunit beta
MIPLSRGPVPSTADAVLIGGGINGLATAYELARQGFKNVVVIENNYIGSGSTGRCGGGIRQQWTTVENIRLAQESVALYENMSADLGYQVFFRQGGYLMVTENESDLPALRDAAALQNQCDVPTEFLQPEECLRLVPDLNISQLKGATFCPKDGTAYPFAVVWGYARACHRAGVKIFIRTSVKKILSEDGRVLGVDTNRGRISSPVVVNCAGPWARSLAAQVGVALPNRQERHEIMVSESLKPFLEPMVISITNGIYFSQSLRGEIVGGIGDPQEPQHESPETFDTRSQLRFAVRFARAFTALYPRAGSVRLMRQWAGMYDVTPDHRPILGGVPGLNGYFHICGFSGHGFMLGPVTGRRMAAHIASGRPDEIITSLSLDRFERGDLQRDAFVVG